MNKSCFVKLERTTRAGLMSMTVPVDVGATEDDTFNAMKEMMGRIDGAIDEVEEVLLGRPSSPRMSEAEKAPAKKGPPAKKAPAKKGSLVQKTPPETAQKPQGAGAQRPPLKPRPRAGAAQAAQKPPQNGAAEQQLAEAAVKAEEKRAVKRPARKAPAKKAPVKKAPPPVPVGQEAVDRFVGDFNERIYELDREAADAMSEEEYEAHFHGQLRKYSNMTLDEMKMLGAEHFATTAQTIIAAVNVDLAGGV